MSIDNLFLAIDDDQPMGVFWADSFGMGVMEIDEFLENSKIDMSQDMAARYADRLQRFVNDLREYSGYSESPTHYAVIDEHGEIVQAFKIASYRNADLLCKSLVTAMGHAHHTSEWTVKGVTVHE